MTTQGQIGEQGVSMVVAELLARDLKPYRPVVDDHGVDLMLSNGMRIQVKSSRLSRMWTRGKRSEGYRRDDKMAYQFSLQRVIFGTKEKLRSVGITYEHRNISKDADFLVLVGIEDRRFWIVPATAVSGCMHITIAQNVSMAKKSPRYRFWKAIRAGENRWDLLTTVPVVPSTEPALPTIHERDPDFVATFAGVIPAEETLQ